MSLSNCLKCWDTPCTCGYYFRDWDSKKIAEHFAAILQYRNETDAIGILQEAEDIVRKNPEKYR
jgi:hypothetical protein